MKNLRQWQIDSEQPASLVLSADTRISRTNYLDDQVWDVSTGRFESPGIRFQTKYGGRADLVSLVPMWEQGGQLIYQAQSYTRPPQITQFAPNYIKIEASLLPNIELTVHSWAMESQAMGVVFALHNTGDTTERLRLDLFGHVIINSQEQTLGIIALAGGGNALHLGQIGNINPVVLLDGGNTPNIGGDVSPKIGIDIALDAGQKVQVRWTHAALSQMSGSLELAQRWLNTRWNQQMKRIQTAAEAIPVIRTGNADWDMVIASSVNQLIQAFITPYTGLPHPSLVATRTPGSGYSPRGDGTDYIRAWEGQDPITAYMAAPFMASIDAALAQGIIKNYLAVQQSDGWIDNKPGMAGQSQGYLCMPILATITWMIYQETEDDTFLKETFASLHQFFERWFKDDFDTNQNGLPEWQHERQTGYVAIPTIGSAREWAQGADIRTLETPDLAAYLIVEAQNLIKIAEVTGEKSAIKSLNDRIVTLEDHLNAMWGDEWYHYRDRDTSATTSAVMVLNKQPGDAEHFPAVDLTPPNRLIVRIEGGVRHTPRLTLHIEGLDQSGQVQTIRAETSDFQWQHRQGIYTTSVVFSQVNRIYCEGLSRVYTVSVRTVDTTLRDINGLLPLLIADLSQENAKPLLKQASGKKHFRRPNGFTMVPASDTYFDPSNAKGGGGVWLFWFTLVAQGLMQHGEGRKAADALKDLLDMQVIVLRQQKQFSQFYHSDEPQGLGERGYLTGVTPIHLLLELAGIRIISSGKVWTGGEFSWGRSITVHQHGVTVRRNRNGTQVTFPSGYKTELGKEAPWQVIVDPVPADALSIEELDTPDHPKSRQQNSSKRVMIEVDFED